MITHTQLNKQPYGFEDVVKGNPMQDQVAKVLHHVKGAKHDPEHHK